MPPKAAAAKVPVQEFNLFGKNGPTDSFLIVHEILDETVLESCGEHAYNAYLAPKVRPYTCLQSI